MVKGLLQMSASDAIATIIREHWVEGWDDPRYPCSVRCMKDGCEWEGRFPGDIADHCADLIAPLLASIWDEGAAAQAASYGMDKDTSPNPYRSH